MNLLSIVAKGGWVMVLIFICSILAVYVIVERFMVLRKARINIKHFMIKIRGFINKGQFQDAYELCTSTPGPIAKVLKKGIRKSDRNIEEVKETIENAGREEIYNLERNMGLLATISGIAPLIGFLGTVTGMIRAFMQIERLEGNVNSSVLAGGIWEALLTTAAGLIVGIFAFGFYNYIMNKVKRFVFELETSSNELIELINERETNEVRNRK